MQFSLDREFTLTLNDPASAEYNSLKNGIEPKIRQQYGRISGFVSASITRFRPGSVIVDFNIKTTTADPTEITDAGKEMATALGPEFPVVTGSFKMIYQSANTITYTPKPMYSGGTVTLTCKLDAGVKLEELRAVEWRRKGRDIKDNERFRIYQETGETLGKLDIRDAIPRDTGLYECTMKGANMDFYQQGQVKVDAAPNIQVKTTMNVQCAVGETQTLECCVQSGYELQWKDEDNNVLQSDKDGNCIKYNYEITTCGTSETTIRFTCQEKTLQSYSDTTKLTIFKDNFVCEDDLYGVGRLNDESDIGCEDGEEGMNKAKCEVDGWRLVIKNCVLKVIENLQVEAKGLEPEDVPQFVEELSGATEEANEQISESPSTIVTIVDILNTVATVSTNVSETVIKDFLQTVDVLISDEARPSWDALNTDSSNSSSVLLQALESVSGALDGDSFSFSTNLTLLNRTTFNNSFSADLNSSVLLNIPNTNTSNVIITTIIFSSLHNALPARNASNQTVDDTIINGRVVLIKVNGNINNVSLGFDKLNESLTLNPQCTFWNFSLFNGLGGWDDEGCELQSDVNGTVFCTCNHLTSFSILMSTSIPEELREVLDIITYIGVGISMGSLVVCLIIEACVWKSMTRNSTSYMRHVSIVNIAVSLLIADIWFIIGASIAKNPFENPGDDYVVPVPACSAATFFIHFFYLALFFWMLVSGLLIFYRTVMVFSHMSRSTMLAIGFCVGYGAPLIIAVTTVASTAPGDGYIRENMACWLNWNKTKALLAFVIPALSIVAINFIILFVVLYKMLRRGVGDTAQSDEKGAIVVIAKCLAILTPFFGLTWALGVGTMTDPGNGGIHISFAFFNSLQGFFILVFGTLIDSKIRGAIAGRLPAISSSTSSRGPRTQSTSAGGSSSSALDFFRRMRNVYNVSDAAQSSSSGATESFISI